MDKNRRRNAQKKVVVAMSGGIDSSVATALFKRAGFKVIGVFMKFWSEPQKNGLVGQLVVSYQGQELLGGGIIC